MNKPIRNRQTKIWSPQTLNGVLPQLRKLKGIRVVRDNNVGTVLVTGKLKSGGTQELLRGIRNPAKQWVVTFDLRLLAPK